MHKNIATSSLIALMIATSVMAQRPMNVPVVSSIDVDGKASIVDEENLTPFDKQLQGLFIGDDAPDEVVAFAKGSSIGHLLKPPQMEKTVFILIRGDRGETRLSADYGKEKQTRQLRADEIQSVRTFVEGNKVEQFSRLEASRMWNGKMQQVIGGAEYIYAHANRRRALRVNMNNPPRREGDVGELPASDALWRYTQVVEFFQAMHADGKE